MMRRREFITLIGGAAAGWPLAARAQQTKMPRIGVLLVSGPEPMGPFREALRDLGYVEGKNIQIEVRSAQGQATRLPGLAAELVRSQVDVIVAVQTPAAHAAKNATRDIPIVMMAGDPIATGLIGNLARPDGNLTGLSATAAEAAAKSLELIPEIVPGARRVGVLGNANDPFMKPFLEQIQRGAPGVRLEVHQIIVRGSDELDGAFAAIARERADAVVIQGSLPVKLTVDMALKYRLPSLSTQKSAVQAGILMSYSASFAERGREIAGYVDKILKGAKPADLPVQQPTKYEIAINLKTAKALGLTVPPMLLARADEVIE
jgi:putative ABC transport system substrate-binding protein